MSAAEVWDRITRQEEAGDFDDVDWAWQDRQADLAEEAARDEWLERQMERAE